MLEIDQNENIRSEAINAALNNNWSEAINLNLTLLKTNPNEIETLNRLARAYMESGLIGKAKSTYRQVLGLDPYNSIAAKNYERLSALSKKDLEKFAKSGNGATPLTADLFLEEPGRTKVMELEDLATSKIIATLHTGDPVQLDVKGREVLVTINDKKLGKLPAEYAEKIAEASRAGSKFNAIIKSVTIKKDSKTASINIFIRETYHSPKLGSTFIFPNNNHMTSFVREDSLQLMDTREGMVVESDDEIVEGPSSTDITPEGDDTDSHHEPILEDEEDFQPS